MTADNNLDVGHFIELDRQSIRFQVVAGVVLLAAGGAVMVGGFGKLPSVGGYDLETITKAGGMLVSLVGLFPFNNCWSRWERIKMLRVLQQNPEALDTATRNELVKKLYSKFLGV
jgi:hypothetical protein